jgi:hypothetical protein
VGVVSLLGFKTPIPYPFGLERMAYLVTNMDAAVRAAKKEGAAVLVAPFPDAIGRDVIVQWPGGVNRINSIGWMVLRVMNWKRRRKVPVQIEGQGITHFTA